MRTLIAFEFKKIFSKKIALIGIAAMLLLNIMFAVSACRNMHAYDGGSREGSGLEAVAIDKAIAAEYAGTLTDEKVQKMLKELTPTVTYDINPAYRIHIQWNATQAAVNSRFSDENCDWNGLSVSDVYGDEEIKIGYVSGWLTVSQYMVRVLLMLAVLIILMIAPVFCGEYGGVDSLILSAKYGKSKCSTAKSIAALLAALSVTALFVIANIAAAFAIYGSEGLDCSVLFAPNDFAEIPLNISCGTLIGYQALLAFTGTICLVGMTLFVSSVCKSPFVSLVASAALFALPVFLPIKSTSPIVGPVSLTPIYHFQLTQLMSIEQMSSGVLFAVWAIPVAAALLILGAVISRMVFSRHQVS